MPNLPRREHFYRGLPAMTADLVTKLDTRSARAFFAVTDMPRVQTAQFLALLAFVHYVDMATAAGAYTVTYPEDVAAVLGCPEATATRYLAELKGHGLAVGSAAAGYRLPDRIESGPVIVQARKTA